MRASQPGPPRSVPAHVWLWSHVQSWLAQVYVCFCRQEYHEQESALETAVWFEDFPDVDRGKEFTCQQET